MVLSTKMIIAVMIVLCIIPSGCFSGPHWKGHPDIPSLDNSINKKEFVVSHFMSSKRQISVTSSATIQTMLEAAHVEDISHQIAQGLAARGVPAKARVDFHAEDLTPNQLLIRGALLGQEPYNKNFGSFLTGYLLTVGIFGLFAPSPIAQELDISFRYRVEVIDHVGNILLSSNDQKFSGYYKSRHIFARSNFEDQDLLHQNAREQVLDELAKVLQQVQR